MDDRLGVSLEEMDKNRDEEFIIGRITNFVISEFKLDSGYTETAITI